MAKESAAAHSPVEVGLLNKTGFNAPLSIESLDRKYRANLAEGLSPDLAIAQPLEETVGDIIGYKNEYLTLQPWLCSPLYKKEYKGRERIFNHFSNQPISEGITRDERFGAVADALSDIEPFLLNAPKNSRAVMYSPAGWSGMKDRLGRNITYPDAQVYFFEVDENGNYQANTLVMDDFVSDQASRFFAAMGYPHPAWDSPFLSPEQKVAEAVRNVIYLEETSETFESIVQTIQKIKGTNVVRHLKDGRVRTFDEVYELMQKGNELLKTDNLTTSQIEGFKTYIKNNKDSLNLEFTQRRAQQELESTVINISRIVRGEAPIDQIADASVRNLLRQQERKRLESLGGCNGGGDDAEKILLQSSLGIRTGEISESKAAKWCTRCQEKNICNTDICYKPNCGGKLTDKKP